MEYRLPFARLPLEHEELSLSSFQQSLAADRFVGVNSVNCTRFRIFKHFEATNLIISYGHRVPDALNDIVKLLGVFISVKDPNLKYLGLETMCKLS